VTEKFSGGGEYIEDQDRAIEHQHNLPL